MKQFLCISRIFEVMYRDCQMLSGTTLILKDQIMNTISQFVFLSPVVLSYKGSYGSEALFGRDVDYFGGSYRKRSSYAVAKCPAAGQGLKHGAISYTRLRCSACQSQIPTDGQCSHLIGLFTQVYRILYFCRFSAFDKKI